MRMRVRLKNGKLTDVFAAYRACVILLSEAPRPKVAALPGYKNAMDPSFIHGNHVYGTPPFGGVDSDLSVDEREWRAYILWVDERIRRLPLLQRDIITVRYLALNRVLSTSETLEILRAGGYIVDEAKMESERKKAFVYLEQHFLTGI